MRLTQLNTLLVSLLCMVLSPGKIDAQHIFSIQDLETFTKEIVKQKKALSDITVWLNQYGYHHDKHSPAGDQFIDKYGNEVVINRNERVPEFCTIDYNLKTPGKEVIAKYEEELKHYNNFDYGGKTSYVSDGKCIIGVNSSAPDNYSINFYCNLHAGVYLPTRRVNKNQLEVSTFFIGTDIKVKKGDKIWLRSSGKINTGASTGSTGPDGIDGFERYKEVKEFKHGALLCYVDDNESYGEPFIKVGSSCVFTAAKDGNLRFLINDSDPSNNEGNFVVTYSINKPL